MHCQRCLLWCSREKQFHSGFILFVCRLRLPKWTIDRWTIIGTARWTSTYNIWAYPVQMESTDRMLAYRRHVNSNSPCKLITIKQVIQHKCPTSSISNRPLLRWHQYRTTTTHSTTLEPDLVCCCTFSAYNRSSIALLTTKSLLLFTNCSNFWCLSANWT